jgi:hypothetical protein
MSTERLSEISIDTIVYDSAILYRAMKPKKIPQKTIVSSRVPREVRVGLIRLAGQKRMRLSDYIRTVLEEHLKRVAA